MACRVSLDVHCVQYPNPTCDCGKVKVKSDPDVVTLKFGIRNAIATTANLTGLRAGSVSELLVEAIAAELQTLGYGCR